MMGVVGVVGILIFCAGAHLLWQARGEVLFWAWEFFRILRGEVTRRGGLNAEARGDSATARSAASPAAAGRRRALVLVGGFALMFLGPLLILLDVAFLS